MLFRSGELAEFESIKRQIRRALSKHALLQATNDKSWGKLKLEELKLIDHAVSHLFLSVPSGSPIKKLHDMCVLHFRPIYLDAFEQVIRLNNLGYRDKTISSDSVYELLKREPSITRWYEVIQVCELVKDIETVNAAQGAAPKIWFSGELDANGNEPVEAAAEQLNELQLIVHHAPAGFGRVMQVHDVRLAKQELRRFERFISRSVRDRTNQLLVFKRELKSLLVRQFDRLKTKAVDLREKLTAFIQGHSVALVMGLFVVSVVLMVALSVVVAVG